MPEQPGSPESLEPQIPEALEHSSPETLDLKTLKPQNPGTLKPWNLESPGPETLEPSSPGALHFKATMLESLNSQPWCPDILGALNPQGLKPWNPQATISQTSKLLEPRADPLETSDLWPFNPFDNDNLSLGAFKPEIPEHFRKFRFREMNTWSFWAERWSHIGHGATIKAILPFAGVRFSGVEAHALHHNALILFSTKPYWDFGNNLHEWKLAYDTSEKQDAEAFRFWNPPNTEKSAGQSLYMLAVRFENGTAAVG